MPPRRVSYGAERLCAPSAPSPAGPVGRTVEDMGDGEEACAGRGDGTDCPNGEVLDVAVEGPRCEECRHYWELDGTEPARRTVEDDGPTRPVGSPGEAGHGDAA